MSSNITKVIGVGILCFVIFCFTQRPRQAKVAKVAVRPPVLENSPVDSKLKPEADTTRVKSSRVEEGLPSAPEVRDEVFNKTQGRSEKFTGEVEINFEHLENLYQVQAHSEIGPKMNQLKPFEGLLSAQERYFYGAFQGLLPLESKILRLNLEFNKSGDRMGRDTCLVVGELTNAGYNILMRAEKLRLYRSNEPGYLVLVADGETYLEIYLSQLSPRKLRAYLTIPGSKGKVPLLLHEKPQQYTGTRFACEDFWPERK